jgi:hypothetical protein
MVVTYITTANPGKPDVHENIMRISQFRDRSVFELNPMDTLEDKRQVLKRQDSALLSDSTGSG